MNAKSFLSGFYEARDGYVRISPEQASRFAKEIADDFNPLHDPASPRFCVPGDLLFALVLERYGVSARMHCRFLDMVGRNVDLVFPEKPGERFAVTDREGNRHLEVEREGPVVTDPFTVQALARSYVEFSGHNFPHVLQPLMEQHGVMINTERPLVIYESMTLKLQEPVGVLTETVKPKLGKGEMKLNGKRAEICLDYALCVDGEPFACGSKRLVAGGLRPYEATQMQQLVDNYDRWRSGYRSR